MLSDRYYYHLFERNERCLEIILYSVARVRLAVLTKWPTSHTCSQSGLHYEMYKDLLQRVHMESRRNAPRFHSLEKDF